MKQVLFGCSLLLAISVACISARNCSQPTNLPSGSTWVANINCTSGGVYITAGPKRQKCHCWGHCGYICESSSNSSGGAGGGGSGGAGGGSRPSSEKPSPCAFGGIWYNPQTGQKCKCQSFNETPYYLCGPSDSSNSSTTTDMTTSTTTDTTTPASSGTTVGDTTTTGGTTAGASST